jgi:SAM-dependent methyltransferase
MAPGARLEETIRDFWNTHPCGEWVMDTKFAADAERFFAVYDAHRYSIEGHILECLDAIDWKGKDVLEIGLGQGADSEQLIRRGARWNGLDLTPEAAQRVRTRLQLRKLPHGEIKVGSILEPPYAPASFDKIYSHGVLHHVPEIRRASAQIAKLLRPGGELVIMMYARWSWHYLLTIGVYGRLWQALAYLSGRHTGDVLSGGYVEVIRRYGLLRYLLMKNFIHHNTDGPMCPYSGVYDVARVKRDFPEFRVVKAYKRYMPVAPWYGHRKPPGESLLGFNLWVHLTHR